MKKYFLSTMICFCICICCFGCVNSDIKNNAAYEDTTIYSDELRNFVNIPVGYKWSLTKENLNKDSVVAFFQETQKLLYEFDSFNYFMQDKESFPIKIIDGELYYDLSSVYPTANDFRLAIANHFSLELCNKFYQYSVLEIDDCVYGILSGLGLYTWGNEDLEVIINDDDTITIYQAIEQLEPDSLTVERIIQRTHYLRYENNHYVFYDTTNPKVSGGLISH